jgi:hypothetical protein
VKPRKKGIKAEDFIQITDEILYLFDEVSAQNSYFCFSSTGLNLGHAGARLFKYGLYGAGMAGAFNRG